MGDGRRPSRTPSGLGAKGWHECQERERTSQWAKVNTPWAQTVFIIYQLFSLY